MLPALFAVASAAATAAPMGFSVNSDAPDGDRLYIIDLATGTETPIGTKVDSTLGYRTDIEGLALSPANQLWAVDEQSFRLFRIDTSLGVVPVAGDVLLSNIGARWENDFGMTFACDGDLYLTSVAMQSLYKVDITTGVAQRIGDEGSLGHNISALAAWGNPPELYGLGNGLVEENQQPDNRSLFRIDPTDGTASLVGQIDPQIVSDYTEAGLSFDANGNLWALTDRSNLGNSEYLGSQIVLIDPATAAVTLVSVTSITGFESLAVAPPGGCTAPPPPAGSLDDNPGDTPQIPTLGPGGLLLTLLLVMATGLAALQRRPC